MAGDTANNNTAASPKVTTRLGADDHRQGMATQTPAELFAGLVFFGGAFIIFSLFHVSTTETAVFGALHLSTVVTPSMTAAQVMGMLSQSMDTDQMIASAIGWGVQIFLLMLAFPGQRYFYLAHKRYGTTATSSSLSQHAMAMAKAKKGITIVLIGMEGITDFLYVLRGHSIFSGVGILGLPGLANPAGLIIALMLPIVTCGVAVFCGPEFFKRLDALIALIFHK